MVYSAPSPDLGKRVRQAQHAKSGGARTASGERAAAISKAQLVQNVRFRERRRTQEMATMGAEPSPPSYAECPVPGLPSRRARARENRGPEVALQAWVPFRFFPKVAHVFVH